MTAHARLGASSAHRWGVCPGSVQGEQEPQSSIYAMEGTAAHDVAEQCLRDGVDAALYIGQEIPVEDQTDGSTVMIEVTAEMAEAVQVYLDSTREAAGDYDLMIEVRVNLEAAKPDEVEEDMFGTVDCAWYNGDERHLHVRDYKHGRGTVVEVEGNWQARYYALGVILNIKKKPAKITTTIVQPRAPHPDGPVRSHTYTWDEIIEFKNELMAAAVRASGPGAPVGPVGSHCKFCPRLPTCPAQHEHALAIAGDEFDVGEVPVVVEPNELSQPDFLKILEAAEFIEDYLKAVREHAHRLLEQGVDVPGWKLVAKRATRKWVDEDKAAGYLQRKLGKSGAYNLKLLSPAQAETALKRADAGFNEHYIGRLITAESSGTNLAREDNPKPAILPGADAVDEFADFTEDA